MIRPLILALILCLPALTQSPQTVPGKRKYNYSGKIETNYDKAKDQTTLFFQLMPVRTANSLDWEGGAVVSDERIALSMYFMYAGQKLVTPKWVGIALASAIYEPKQYGDYTLTINYDNQTMTVGQMTVVNRGETRNSPVRPTVKRQWLEASLPYEQFLSMANAKKVKLKIGDKAFPLEQENLEAIRDLASRTVP